MKPTSQFLRIAASGLLFVWGAAFGVAPRTFGATLAAERTPAAPSEVGSTVDGNSTCGDVLPMGACARECHPGARHHAIRRDQRHGIGVGESVLSVRLATPLGGA